MNVTVRLYNIVGFNSVVILGTVMLYPITIQQDHLQISPNSTVTDIHTQSRMLCLFKSSGSSLSLVLGPFVFPPGSVQFDTQTREVIKLLQVETLLKAIHKAVLWVQTKTHSPKDLCVFLAQVVKCVHQFVQVRVGIHHISC